MEFPSQLANPQRAQQLAAHLSTLVSESSQSIIIFGDKQGNYLGLTGGVGSPTELRFANPHLQREFKNRGAYSSVMLDCDENQRLRPEECELLNDLASRFNRHTGEISGFEVIGKLTKPLDGSTQFEGKIPLGLPFALNNDDSYALLLRHIGGLEKIHDLKRSSDLTFYSVQDQPYARVTVPTTIPQSFSGLDYQQPAQLSVVFDLHAGATAGYELTVDGKPASESSSPSAAQWKQIEGVIVSRLGELSPSPDNGEKGWVSFAAPRDADRDALTTAMARERAQTLAARIEGVAAFLEPHLQFKMSSLVPNLSGEYAGMSLGNFSVRMVNAAAQLSGLLRWEDQAGRELPLRSLTAHIASRLRDPSTTVTDEQLVQIEEVFDTLKFTAFNCPETYVDRYPALVAALQPGASVAISHSGEVFQEALDALQRGELSSMMAARRCGQLQIQVGADGTEYGVALTIGSGHGEISYSLFRNGAQREFSFNNEEAQVYNQINGMLGREIDSRWELGELLGFPLEDVWKAWEDERFEDLQNIPYRLLRAQGLRPSIRSGIPELTESREVVSPEGQKFNEMLLAGIKKVHEIGHVIVNWHSMSYRTQIGEHADVYGPMSKERFAELYPKGIIGNNLLFARQELVGDTPYPPEFYAVPFYLSRLGYSYDEANKEWLS
jgi:hypothetical protein